MSETVLCLLCGLVAPIGMIFAGLFMWRFPPKYKGMGYHTQRAESSPAAWAYAQVLAGKTMLFSNIPLLIISALAVVYGVLAKLDENGAAILLMIITGVQIAVIFVAIAIVEKKLCKMFDKNGNPK